MLDMEEIVLNKAGMCFRVGAGAGLYKVHSTAFKTTYKMTHGAMRT